MSDLIASRHLSVVFALCVAAGAFLPMVGHANDKMASLETIQVQLDQAKLLKLPGGTETIVVGNPAIADVAVQKNGVMVITGRTPGRTNFIALDGTGTIISESIVSVTSTTLGRILVQRGMERSSYDCAPNCLPTISQGDEEKHFSATIDQSNKRDAMANQSSANQSKK